MLAMFSSCSKDDPEVPVEDSVEVPIDKEPVLPTISLQSGSAEVVLGVVGGSAEGSLSHTIKAEVPEGMVSLKISKVLNGETTEYATVAEGNPDYSKGMVSATYELDYIFSEKDVEQDLYFIAEVLDEEGNTIAMDFAKAWVKMPLIKDTFSLQTAKNEAFNPLLHYYLYIDGEDIKQVKRSEAALEENNKKIAAILSFNDDSEFYLASPTDVDEGVLTDALPSIAKTKFKYDALSDQPLSENFNQLDVHEIEKNYEDLLFAEKDERIEKLKIGNRFYFKTADGRIAILQVSDIVSVQPLYTMFIFDILITQKI